MISLSLIQIKLKDFIIFIKSFFERVDAKIERGYKHEDISYQLDLSADVLREIIKGYPVKEVLRHFYS